MTQFYSQHAKERAWERYGLALSSTDMAEILRATKDGRAQRMQVMEGSRVFLWTFKGRQIIAALREEEDFIVSFLPADYFLKSSREEHKTELGQLRIGHRRHPARDKNYRRPKSNRRALADQVEAEEE